MLGDMLSSMFNVIGFSWISSPACTELETVSRRSLPSRSIKSLCCMHAEPGLPEVTLAASYMLWVTSSDRAVHQIVLDWFAKLLDLPEVFLSRRADGSEAPGGGVIQVLRLCCSKAEASCRLHA